MTYQPGDKVQVEWGGDWLNAEIGADVSHRVHFEKKYQMALSPIVIADRIRIRPRTREEVIEEAVGTLDALYLSGGTRHRLRDILTRLYDEAWQEGSYQTHPPEAASYE